eukprot:TRINITY_DN439_c0_g1_i2.p1 TRINITY_DN439_c0_g1~~TRINITY_DN439_c0_g1_i2.p1  ORF type:complete len:415 (+),score=63.91 TRINITY_DN439_c0_g1_i2:1049-2293(+)
MGVPRRLKKKQVQKTSVGGSSGVQQVWRSGVDEIGDGEELTYDPSVYTSFKDFLLEWPCLSFAIIKDGLGGPRQEYPHTFYLAAGTQAESARQNFIALVKVSNMQGNKQKSPQGEEEDEDYEANPMPDDEEEDDGDEEKEEDPAKLSFRKIQHNGGINRLRSMPQQPSLLAAWADSGSVQIWEVSEQLQQLVSDSSGGSHKAIQMKPKASHSHGVEGFALDWSPVTAGQLASGNNKGKIFVWNTSDGVKWNVGGAYIGHENSVEDIQWSHSEENVFISCSSDRTIRVWDVRERTKSMLAISAHNSDVNVISWNPLVHYTLLSGDDDGCIKVWDLRSFNERGQSVASFSYHKGPITSLEWCPQESSTFVSTSADDQLIVWDLAVERDPEEEVQLGPKDNAELLQFPMAVEHIMLL